MKRQIKTLAALGDWLKNFCRVYPGGDNDLSVLVRSQHIYNPWLTEEFVLKALNFWSVKLSKESLETTCEKYPNSGNSFPRHVAVVPQANVPLAGLHDLIAVLLTGNHFYGKNLNHENDLLQTITNKLISIEPDLHNTIHWVPNFPKNIDSYLVFTKPEKESTLSSYFKTRRILIREKQISIGIVSPDDDASVYQQFAKDIFLFFGLSDYCIRKIFVPQGFSLPLFIDHLEEYSYLYQFNRYANNYDYHKSVFMMDRIPFLDNGFLILRESTELKVPLGCLYFEFYQSIDKLQQYLKLMEDSIQHVVTSMSGFENSVKPGYSHSYPLWEFPNRKDTVQFLLD
jgi:hypothetical protein